MGKKPVYNLVHADFVNRSRVPVRRQWVSSGESFCDDHGVRYALIWTNDSAIPEVCRIDENGIKYDFAVDMNRFSVFGAMGIYFRRVAVAWNDDRVSKRILLEFSFSADSSNNSIPSRY